MDAFAVSVSHGLQYGVPIKKFVRAFTNTSFAPSGITDDKEIRTASSLIDYIFRRIGKTYMSFDDQLEVGLASIDDMPKGQTSLLSAGDNNSTETPAGQAMETLAEAEAAITEAMTTIAASTADLAAAQSDSVEAAANPAQTVSEARKSPVQDAAAPLCYNCGNQTMRAGTCYVCTACGSTTGCS
jgi:ribonucleoside-diphosphate reductase alpha chain